MSKTPKFLVGTSSDPREIRRAVIGLRAMAKMGKLAERALLDLREKGHYEGRAPWVRLRSGFLDLTLSRFPEYPEITRQSVPGYGRPAVHVEADEDASYVVTARMTCFAETGWGIRVVRIGRLRMNTKLGTFFPSLPALARDGWNEDREQKSISISLSQRISDHRVAAFARVLAENAAGRLLTLDPRCAVFCRRLQSWLVEDGHALSILNELRDFSRRHSVVQHVMHR